MPFQLSEDVMVVGQGGGFPPLGEYRGISHQLIGFHPLFHLGTGQYQKGQGEDKASLSQ